MSELNVQLASSESSIIDKYREPKPHYYQIKKFDLAQTLATKLLTCM